MLPVGLWVRRNPTAVREKPYTWISEKLAVSVFDLGFEEAWKSISQETKKLHIDEKCVTCSLRHVCQVCPATAYLETGRYDGVLEYLCRYSKEIVRILQAKINDMKK